MLFACTRRRQEKGRGLESRGHMGPRGFGAIKFSIFGLKSEASGISSHISILLSSCHSLLPLRNNVAKRR